MKSWVGSMRKYSSFNKIETMQRAKSLIEQGKYWVYLACQYEVRGGSWFCVDVRKLRSVFGRGLWHDSRTLCSSLLGDPKGIGRSLLKKTMGFGRDKGWKRLEVTTPPLPHFERTLYFYQVNGFEIVGGRKLKVDIVPR